MKRYFPLLALCLSSCTISHTEWSYSGNTGPEYWGKLSPDYQLCSTGMYQSPVNIVNTHSRTLPDITVNYSSSPLSLENDGHTIEITQLSNNSITIGNQLYTLQNIHFHTPGEHAINGKVSALEIHFVHKNQQGNLAVIGVMVNQGMENKELQKLWNHLPKEKGQITSLAQEHIHLEYLLPQHREYFNYTGSLTVPPCSEQVDWYLMKQPIQASLEQINSFKAIYNHNARPTQPLHKREVLNTN